MKIEIHYAMRAFIEADTIEDAKSVWEKANLETSKHYRGGDIKTCFVNDDILAFDERGQELEEFYNA